MASNVVVNILGDNKDLDRALDGSKSRMSKFGSVMKTAGKAGGLAVAAGAVVAGKALFDMTKAAVEDQAAQVKLATALRNSAGATDSQVSSVEKWITAQGKALGVADDDLRPALGRLVTATKDVGKAQQLASLAMDTAAGSGASLDSVTKALAKAQNGSVAGLAKFGINVKNAKGETISFAQAQKRLSQAFKGQAEAAASTPAGKFAILKLQLAEIGEEIGAKLLPVATRLGDFFLNKGLPAVQAFGSYLSDRVPPIFEKVKAVVASVFGGGGGGGGIAETLRQAFETVKAIFKDGISIIQSLWRAFGGNIVGFVKGWFKSVAQILRGAFQVIRGLFKVVSSLLKGDWKGVWKGLQLILKGAVNILIGLVKNLWNTIKFAFKNAGVVLKAILKAAWDGLVSLAREGVSRLVDHVRSIPGKIRDIGSKFLDAGKFLIDKFFAGLKALGDIGANIGSSLLNGVIDGINSGINAVNSAIPNSIGIGPASINLPDDPFPTIPRLAHGGITTGPMLAIIGDNPGGREAVIPLDKYALGGNTYIIHQHVAPTASLVDAGRELVKALDAFEAAGGRVPAR